MSRPLQQRARWRIAAIVAISVVIFMPYRDSMAKERNSPSDTLLMFVASWCAPCRAELSRIDEVIAAARPLRVLVVPLDRGRRTDDMLRPVPPAMVWHPGNADRARLQEQFFRDNAGLPFAAIVNADGTTCATNRTPLDGKRVIAMAAACAASATP